MDFCTNCGGKLHESNRSCTNCGSRVASGSKNMSSTPKTRMEKKKNRSKTKLLAGVGSIIGVLLVSGVTYSMVKGSNKPQPKANAAATKTIVSSKSNEDSSHDQQSTEEKSKEASNLSSSDIILPASDKLVLSEDDIDTIPKWQLRLARNEIYARHGYVFKSKDLQGYFSSKSWYHPNPSFDGSLNDVERKNVALIKKREDSL